MKPDVQHPDEEYTLPPTEALLAGTLALMTGYAQAAAGDLHRSLLALDAVTKKNGFLEDHFNA